MGNDYKHTMNLPKTDFSMKANLPENEPKRLKKWSEQDIYHKVLEKNKDGEPFILHDGPPYANGPIHIGHAFNKILKDFVVKSHAQRGYFTPYIPGWDCHGQPIEHEVEKKLGTEKMNQLPQATIRRLCREWAEKFVDVQRDGFMRLGVNADWFNPYLTFMPTFESANVEVFKKLYLDGAVYRGRKPIHWCSHCHTALAEAEIEYGDEVSPAIFVTFELTTVPEGLEGWEGKVDVAIWTTTPWTLPADDAVILHPDAEYVAVERNGRAVIFARALAEKCCAKFGWDFVLVNGDNGELWARTGTQLAYNRYKQPIFGDQGEEGLFIYADYVTLDDGTGIVHSAPGHGVDDYKAGMKFDVPVIMPVDDNGCFYVGDTIGFGGPFSGMEVNEANPKIIEWLDERGMLILHEDINHSYPHCWRCHRPVIFRATNQWFVSMDETGLREKALDQIYNHVDFYPEWGVNRIGAMVTDRPDWCISRQRSWGVPIPVFKCGDCGETIADEATFDAVIDLFNNEGADAWFTKEPVEYLPETTCCPKCGSRNIQPEKDILDVWWESGVSHVGVLQHRAEADHLRWPADMYLEGSDQHRGWFQSSLLLGTGAFGQSPYKSVVCCGFTVDENGEKMSKSKGNGIDPKQVADAYGADVLRLWVASTDYSVDVSIGDTILKRTSDAYRRFRNSFRFLLGNLSDFDDMRDAVALEDMKPIDVWAMLRLAEVLAEVERGYDEYRFHQVFRVLYDYVITDLSAIYMDVAKDRLYSEAPGSLARRSAQTVLMNILEVLVRVMSPILSFTCDEVWEHYPEAARNREGRPISVQLAGWPTVDDFVPAIPQGEEAEAFMARFNTLLEVRDVVTKALEDARNAGELNKSQEAVLTITAPADVIDVLNSFSSADLEEFFIVSDVIVIVPEDEEVTAAVGKSSKEKCPRCWNHRKLGGNPNHPDVCARCGDVLDELGE
ncbi:isoleucine--tRNA ligase [Slackia heliotrinireducens]|uniref:isoleucine--tRNA ligase n=1 Tax=Slackia heliotrinireducens TaxID=84110 RepID=UPI003315142E